MLKLSVLTILFILQFTEIKSARILAVYPTPSISHQLVFRSLTDELVKRGHHVTVVTTDPKYSKERTPQNLTEIDVHNISYSIWKEALIRLNSEAHKSDLRDDMIDIFKLMSEIFKAQVELPELQEIIRKKDEYDLLLLEAYLKPTLGLSHIFKVPVIQVSSLGGIKYNYDAQGAPTHMFLYPSPVQQKLYGLTYLDKLKEFYKTWNLYRQLSILDEEDNRMLKSMFGPDVPTIHELFNNVDLLMVNNHPIWVENQPVPPNVVYINGLHIPPSQALPKDLQTYLDSSKNGVIYFSLGTNVRPELLPPQKIQMMLKVFSQLPYNILWKWNLDKLPGISDNVKVSKWLPQPDVLRHPNIKLFITQGGLQSTDEAITAGVPLVGIPMLSDQWYNVQKYVRHGIGVQLDMALLTEDNFRNAIEKVINDKSYKQNMLRLRSIVEDQPMSSADRAAWWVEYVIRHKGAKHLKAAGANMSWREYFEVDLVIITLSVIISLLAILIYVVHTVWKYVLNNYKTNIKLKTF